MNTQEISLINYKFSRNILSRAILRNPKTFYEKYISKGYPAFLHALKTAWINVAKGFSDEDISIYDVDIALEITHVYDNGDFVLLVSLPFVDEGCDMLGFYIKEDYSIDFSNLTGNLNDSVDIKYFIFYKTNHVDKYTLLEVSGDMSVKNKGYISASERLLLKKLYIEESKKLSSR